MREWLERKLAALEGAEPDFDPDAAETELLPVDRPQPEPETRWTGVKGELAAASGADPDTATDLFPRHRLVADPEEITDHYTDEVPPFLRSDEATVDDAPLLLPNEHFEATEPDHEPISVTEMPTRRGPAVPPPPRKPSALPVTTGTMPPRGLDAWPAPLAVGPETGRPAGDRTAPSLYPTPEDPVPTAPLPHLVDPPPPPGKGIPTGSLMVVAAATAALTLLGGAFLLYLLV